MSPDKLTKWADGMIEPGSDLGKKITFTLDRWAGSWLWKQGDYVILSMIMSREKGKGHMTELITKILEGGLGVKVPTPMGIMPAYLRKHNFEETEENDPHMGCMEVWVKHPGEEY